MKIKEITSIYFGYNYLAKHVKFPLENIHDKGENLMNTIIKVMTLQAWENAKEKGIITEPSLQEEGFIHCSFLNQSLQVAHKHFAAESSIVFLTIDPERVQAEIKYELAANGEHYPHIYGVIHTSAIINIHTLNQHEDRTFTLPAELI